MTRPDIEAMRQKWHEAVNRYHHPEKGKNLEHRKWMYEAMDLANESSRLALLFKSERLKTLPTEQCQCSHSPVEEIDDNHLRCCLGVECRKCPELVALDQIQGVTPEGIDQAKAWTCCSHILMAGGDFQNEGYVLTSGDRRFWNNVYDSLASEHR